jgi:hypothetical protein
MEAIINGDRENHRIGATTLIRLLEFAGTTDFNLRSISGKVINMEKNVINNQTIAMKMSQITLNLILKVQNDMKNGINWLKNIIERGIKFEFNVATNGVNNEFNIKITMLQGMFENSLTKIRKTIEIGSSRMFEFTRDKFETIENHDINMNQFEAITRGIRDNGQFLIEKGQFDDNHHKIMIENQRGIATQYQQGHTTLIEKLKELSVDI